MSWTGTSVGKGELDGTSGGKGELDGTSGGPGELDGTSGGPGELHMNNSWGRSGSADFRGRSGSADSRGHSGCAEPRGRSGSADTVYSILHILANTVGHVEKLYIAHSILQRHQYKKML